MRTENFIFEKTPEAIMDFSINWSALVGTNPIDSSDWTIDAGLTILSTNISGVYTTFWISGGDLGNTYCGQNIITTGALTDSAVFSVNIR